MKDNFNASKTILSLISNELIGNGIKFGVIIIPSKSRVLEQWSLNMGIETPEDFSAQPEITLIAKYISFLNEKDIPAIDATPFVVEAFAESAQMDEEFYPFENDHPLEKGYESYGLAAAKLISQIDQSETS